MDLELVREERNPEALFHKVGSENKQKSILACDFCDKSFTNEETLSAHVLTIHRTIIEGKKFPKLIENKESANYKSNLKLKSFGYECEFCDEKFQTKYLLNCHVTKVHKKSTSNECNLCGKTFVTTTVLIRHINTVHETERNHKCDLCG